MQGHNGAQRGKEGTARKTALLAPGHIHPFLVTTLFSRLRRMPQLERISDPLFGFPTWSGA